MNAREAKRRVCAIASGFLDAESDSEWLSENEDGTADFTGRRSSGWIDGRRDDEQQ